MAAVCVHAAWVARCAARVAGSGVVVLVQVIIESALLTPQEIIRACEVVRDGGAGFVKTSTGYHARGVAAARLMRRTVGEATGVKASDAGGVTS